MAFWSSAFRYSKRYTPREHIRAAVVTALLPAAAAVSLLWFFPKGCDLRGDPAVYRWTCLLPGLTLTVPFAVAVGLLLGTQVNYRLDRLLPDGWLATTLFTGILTQILLAATYMFAFDLSYRGQMVAELLSIPQPFVAGALAAAVYHATLNWKFGKRNQDHPSHS